MTSTAAAPTPAPVTMRTRAWPSLLDVLLGGAVGASLLWAMTLVAGLGSPIELPWTAFAAHGAVVVGTALYRSAPRVGLIVAIAGVGGYHALGGVPVGLAWPLLLPCYGVARRGHLHLGVAAAGLHLAAMLAYRWAGPAAGEPLGTLHAIAQEGLLLAAALLVGEVVRSRAQQAADAREHVRLLARQHEQETQRRIAQERLAIAHDLHDVAAHTVSVITLHANVAEERFDEDPHEAREAIATIRSTSQQAARDLRAVVGLLRDGRGDEPPASGLAAIATSVERARGTGLDVDLHLDVDERLLAGAVGVAAGRIVQESLTNVLRHADATRAEVRLDSADGQLELAIRDDGRGQRGGATTDGGVGLRGMRERAELLGGTCEWRAGPAGFVVTCRLPLERGS